VETPKTEAAARPAVPAAAEVAKPGGPVIRASAGSGATTPSVPNSPAAALDRVNAYFNSIDQLTAYFVQSSTNGQRAEGNLSIKRPGQLHFAYAPPSSLEVVSDGRSVAVRDKKLGTNDVYSIRQTPLKFLVQDKVDLAKDTKIQDVQVGSDGVVTVRFEDSATLGGTSKITLRFDARANALKQWSVIDAQGYETTVVLSNLNLVRRTTAEAVN
jgi:outer membrane lipoprotein-sorting protein